MSKKANKKSLVNIIQPQEGYQMKFLSSKADIVIGGGAAGVGKTFSLLLEVLRHKDVPDFGSVIFRRTSPQIRAEGALWDTSNSIYNFVSGAESKESSLEWDFGKSKLKFSHLEYQKNIYDWQGAQIPLLAFDELTHFTKKMFFYMLTRNRSTCGVRPYVRTTCNPDPDSWVAELISWWIDQESGFPIPERDGKLRYMLVDGDKYIWGDSIGEVVEKAWYILGEVVEKAGINPKDLIKSVTFISGSIYDNRKLLTVDPSYLGNLLAQDIDTQSSLLKGNWKRVKSEKDIYDHESFLGMFVNKYQVSNEGKYITADIAMKGSDKFVVGVWYGYELVDIYIMSKSKGNEVIEGIEMMAKKHKVQNHNIIFDNDGVGSFVDGFIEGAIEFNNGSKALNGENYFNLKTQCFYRSGEKVAAGEYSISEEVYSRMYDDKMTIKQRFMFERRAIKRDKIDIEGKLRIISKPEMKTMLNGDSPDLMDMFMMRSYFDYKNLIPQNLEGLFGI